MVYFPVRKCYHVAKVCGLLILVVTILALFEQWRGGKRSAKAEPSDPEEAEYERQILEDETRIIPGLGEGGDPAVLSGLDHELGVASEKKYAMNVYLSDRIAYNRSLKDHRNPACSRVTYDAELPSASVILIFHNEPYSVVIRTIWSVINSARRNQPWFKQANFIDRQTGQKMKLGSPDQDPNSPLVYLKEIILVDDNSTLPELKGKMSHYVRTRLPPDLIKILRLPDRIGLTRARLAGARFATGDVMVFLDAHCEVQEDWLRPLLQEIKNYPHAVLVPIIDVIDSSNFYYSVQNSNMFQVGGFTFTGHFTWVDVPDREKKRRGSDISPTWSPTMAGGLFAINRAYYWEIGAYDEQMAGWGGENLEMSFRIWQCGGTLETIPCSRVGHVFRSFHPYGLPAASDTHGINTARMAEVWMDEYAELFYMHRPDLRNNPKIGDVTHRKILREKLMCKSFQWYLDNIYREKYVPVRDVYGYGRFHNVGTTLCLDTLQREGEGAALGVYPCHSQLQATQYLSLSLRGQLRDEEKCAHPHYNRQDEVTKTGRQVFMSDCRDKQRNQIWKYLPSQQLKHVESLLCLESAFEAGSDVLLKPCDPDAPSQKWKIDFSEKNDFKTDDFLMPNDKLERLKRIKGRRRISRSILSLTEPELNEPITYIPQNNTRRHSHKSKHAHKKHAKKRSRSNKKRTKNKFILKLVRTLMNDTDEHLEVDIHCKHHQLYPNNTFVRDLVTILNEKNIKVINNGRVFERNKVSDLDAAVKERTKVLNKLDIVDQPPDTQVEPLPKSPHEKSPGKRVRTKKHKKSQTSEPVVPVVPEEGEVPRSQASPAPRQVQRVPGTLLSDITAGNAAEGPRQRPRGPGHKNNIIIEDFVEIKSVNNDKPASKHRKRKHKKVVPLAVPLHQPPRAAPRPPAPRPAPQDPTSHSDIDGEELMKLLTNKLPDDEVLRASSHSEEGLKQGPAPSMEDSPMLDGGDLPGLSGLPTGQSGLPGQLPSRHGDDSDDEDWSVGLSQFRRNNSDLQLSVKRPTHKRTHTHKHTNTHTHTHTPECVHNTRRKKPTDTDCSDQVDSQPGLKPEGSASQEAPVKVVMKSNFTFNLGDEFFTSRRHWNTDDNDLAGDLTIPTNSSREIPTIHDWVKLTRGSDVARSQSRGSGKPQSSGSVMPQSQESGKPQSQESGKPQSTGSGMPQSQDSGKPQSQDSGKPQSRRQNPTHVTKKNEDSDVEEDSSSYSDSDESSK